MKKAFAVLTVLVALTACSADITNPDRSFSVPGSSVSEQVSSSSSSNFV
jgi:hypothetical protein